MYRSRWSWTNLLNFNDMADLALVQLGTLKNRSAVGAPVTPLAYRGVVTRPMAARGSRHFPTRMLPISYARHQFPPAVILLAIWLYLRFTLSCRDVEELLAERGIDES